MSARSRYIHGGIKRRLASPPFKRPRARRKRRKGHAYFPVSVARLKELLFRAAVAAALLVLVFGAIRLFNPHAKIHASAETVAAFRAPYRSLGMLQAYAAKYGVPFQELFTLFCAENAFFPEKTAAYDLSVLEQLYAQNFDRLKGKYDSGNIAPYVEMYANLFSEIECFPIPAGFDGDEQPSFMYGDSWGVTRNFEGDRAHKGADLYDRENIRGRIPIVSMTGGTVQEAGWHDKFGYYVGVLGGGGTYYLYAHLDSLADNITAGQSVTAGQMLGRMGDSGSGQDNQVFQVHLHLGISPKAGFTKNQFWINPYPLLRYIENTPLI